MKIRTCFATFILFLAIGVLGASNAVTASSEDSPILRDLNKLREISEGKMADYYWERSTAVSPPSVFASNADYPQFPNLLAIQALRDGNFDIYLKDPESVDVVRLTSEPSVESSPSLNNGATRVAFVTNRNGNDQIYQMDTSGLNLSNISQNNHNDFNPSWSRDNSRLAFNSFRTGNSELFIVNADGSHPKQVTNHPAYDGQPSWSPDGSQLVFTSLRTGRYELWKINADGTNLRQLTFGSNALYPAWSPGGERIAFAKDGNNDGWLELWVINSDGTGAYRLQGGTALQDHWLPSWSPDGGAIAFTATYWVEVQGQYYWYQSYIHGADPFEPGRYLTLSGETKAWRSSWASMDASGPNPCVIQVAAEQNQSAFILAWNATDVGEAGVRSYDVEMRRNSMSPWQSLKSNSLDTQTRFQAPDGALQFRCRAQDHAYNWGAWGEPATTFVDTQWPNSHVLPLPKQTQGTVTVQWVGNSSDLRYDIFVKDGEDGNWEIWQSNVTQTSAPFTGTPGHTYYFRSRARDGRQLEPWQADPHTVISIYVYSIKGFIKDNRGIPVAKPTIELNPIAVDTEQNAITGEYSLFVAAPADYTLHLSADGHNPLPATSIALNSNTTFNAFLPPASEAMSNGSFEAGSLDGWTSIGSGATVATNARHTGDFGLLFNQTTAAKTLLTQTVTVENGWNHPTLSFLYHIPTRLSGGSFQVQLSNGPDTITALNTTAATTGWQQIWADLAAFSGQTITLTLSLDQSIGDVWLDEFSVGPWQTPHISSFSPTRWRYQEPTTLTISGSNFIDTPAIFLNEIALEDVLWMGENRLQATVPSSLPEGNYILSVVNPGGNRAVGSQTITVAQERTFLPLVSKPGISTPSPTADWVSLGYDASRTSFNQIDPGASRYRLLWSKNLPFPGAGTALQNIAVSNSIVVATSEVPDGTSAVVALDLETGMEIWRQEMNSTDISPPTIAYGAVYIIQTNIQGFDTESAYLHAFDLLSGLKLWQTTLVEPYTYTTFAAYYRPVVCEGKIIMGGANLLAVDAFTGKRLWNSSWGWEEIWIPAYSNGNLYTWIGNYFNSHRVTNGETIWSLMVRPVTAVSHHRPRRQHDHHQLQRH
jgi:Tol biopolymer transport system component